MKIRNSFVSNSSSSSFIIETKYLSRLQIIAIKHYRELCDEFGVYDCEPNWNVREENGMLYLNTSMDNFDMRHFLNQIGVNDEYIKYE